jgi:glutamate/tyrosine decarboxylase-like PLP-dependent enzyme
MKKNAVLEALENARQNDIKWREGKVFSLVYDPGDEVVDLLKQAYSLYFSENALNPTAFPSLRKFETEVIAMTASLLGSDGKVVGNMTTGGTESLIMAVKTARDWARHHRPEIQSPEMIMPSSAHPALEKAGHYMGVRSVRIPVSENFRGDVDAIKAAMNPNTILVVGSAPSFPHGVVDPIHELGQITLEHGILLHVDACVGGFMLPFVRQLGYSVPEFDFTVPGVTSLSVDLHKFGYSAKGASVILYRDRAIRRHQFFAYTDWSGGIYASPTMTGTRSAGPIAASWAIMNHLGYEGYLDLTRSVMQTTTQIREGIEGIDGIRILGDPEMSILAIASDTFNVYEIADELSSRSWYLERQQFPPSLHLTINYGHTGMADAFLQDLREAVAQVRKPNLSRFRRSILPAIARFLVRLLPEWLVTRLFSRASGLLGVKGASLPTRSAPMYGMMATLPNRGDVKELVLDVVEQFTEPQE